LKLFPTDINICLNTYTTDSNNFIIDLSLSEINDSLNLENQLKGMPGVVEVGLFNNIADLVIVGKNNSTEMIERI
jgi:ribose 5-phosphate isomerase A